MLRSALSSLAILLSVSLSAGCEQKTAPTPEKAAATTNQPSTAVTDTSELPATQAATATPTAAAPADSAPTSASAAEAIPTAPTAQPAAKPAPTEVSAAKADEAPATKGTEAKGASFGAWLQGGKYEVGKPGTLTAVLTAQGQYHCNDKYPYKFTLDAAPTGVSFPSSVVKGMAVTEKRATMSIPFSASEKGAKTISGTLAFSVCDADRCLIEKQKLSVTVNVM